MHHFSYFTRTLFFAAALNFGWRVFAQTPPQSTDRLSAIVQVQRDSIGANLVKISILDSDYPLTVLRRQVEELGKLTGSGARGIQVSDAPIDPADPKSRILRCTFAVDGLVDRKGEWLKVGPIAKALAGAPSPHELKNVQIDFDFERATPSDLENFSSKSVDITRRMVDRSLEYSVHLKSQNQNEINVPDFAPDPTEKAPQPPPERVDLTVIFAFVIAVLAAGALVYCLFLLKPSRTKKVQR